MLEQRAWVEFVPNAVPQATIDSNLIHLCKSLAIPTSVNETHPLRFRYCKETKHLAACMSSISGRNKKIKVSMTVNKEN